MKPIAGLTFFTALPAWFFMVLAVNVFEWEIGNDDPVETGGPEVLGRPFDASHKHRIVVGKPDERRIRQPVLCSTRKLERSIEGHASREGTLRGALDRRPIRKGIRVRDSDLDEIGAAIASSCDDVNARSSIRVSRHDKRDERGPAFITTSLENVT